MNVSIVIPCLNEEENVEACLCSLLKQRYGHNRYEIIVVDNGSTDRSPEIIAEIVKKNTNVHLINEPQKGTAPCRNAGIKAAKHDHIALIDADCEAPPRWLEILVEHYRELHRKDQEIIGVGGSNIPPKHSGSFIRAIGIALDSYIGSFNSVQGRKFNKDSIVPSISTVNALYDKQVINQIGCFDASLSDEAEDADLNFRINLAGYKLYYIPESYVWHKMRPTAKTWLKNMFRYGKGRARLLKRYPKMWSINFVLPIFFFCAMILTLLIPLSKIFLLPTLYVPLIFFFSLIQCNKYKSKNMIFHVMLVYYIEHIGYAAGEIYGLLNPNVK